MLQAFIVTLREGVEAALIVGIVLAYLTKVGRPDLRKLVFTALGAALAGSVVAAYLLSRFQIDEELFEGWVMLTAAFFVITMIVFMMRTARTLKRDIETRVDRLATRGSRIGLFLFVFLMVLREGAETVLILSALSLNTSDLMSLLGTLTGVGVAVAFGVMFVKGSVRVDLRKFFRVTTVILFFVAFQLIVSGLHEFSEVGVIPANRQSMALIGPIVRNDIFFFVTILALAALMILFEYRRRQPETVTSATKAEQRKAEWSARRERMWAASVYASAFVFIVLVTAQFIYAKSTSELSPATPLALSDGFVSVPAAQVRGGDLHRFVVDVDGVPVRFFLIEKPDGKIASLLDACEICGAVGFYQRPDGVICKNCDAPINPMSLGQGGGCNPIPLAVSGDEGTIRIAAADLKSGSSHFISH